jgi:hypothetical protein
VQLPAGPPFARHEQTPLEDAHGATWHNWTTDGWEQFDPVTITVDVGQTFVTSVPTGTGLVLGTGAGHGNHRVAYLRKGTDKVDGEISATILGPVGWNAGGAQQGVIHRVRQISPGLWEGIAVWTAVVGGGYNLINTRGVRWDGVTLFQSDGDLASSADTTFIDRSLRVWARQRFQFGQWVGEYHALPAHLWGLAVGDVLNVASVSGLADETGRAATVADRISGVVQIQPATTGAVAWAPVPAGTITPAGDEKRWCPFVLRSRVVGHDPFQQTVEWMRYRLGEPPPDWSDPRVQRKAIAANASVPRLAVDQGLDALWNAHMHDGSGGRWGDLRFQAVAA